MELKQIIHLGIVVADLEKAVDIYENKLGIGPWKIDDPRPFFSQMDIKHSGEKNQLNINTAMFKGDGYEIELVMPVGEGFYQDWLNEHGPGLHHVKFAGAHYDDVVNTAKEISGREPYLDARFPDGNPICAYADLIKEAGLIIEVGGDE